MNTDQEKPIYVIDEGKLRKGDIILSASKDRISKIIQIATLGKFSHARIYLGSYSYAEAPAPEERVSARNLQRLFFHDDKNCCIMRLKENVENDKLDEIVDQARRYVDMLYSLPEAKRVVYKRKAKALEDNRQFCSRYVAQAYERAGISIVNGSDYCSPGDLYKSKLMMKIDLVLRIATDEEISMFYNTPSPTDVSEKSRDYLYDNVSSISNMDIQTMEQLNSAVIIEPQLDNDFTRIILESKFLNLWNLEFEKEPWSFDYELFINRFGHIDVSELMSLAEAQLSRVEEARKRYIPNLSLLKTTYAEHPLKTIALQISLYENLLDHCNQKEVVFNRVLRLEKQP